MRCPTRSGECAATLATLRPCSGIRRPVAPRPTGFDRSGHPTIVRKDTSSTLSSSRALRCTSAQAGSYPPIWLWKGRASPPQWVGAARFGSTVPESLWCRCSSGPSSRPLRQGYRCLLSDHRQPRHVRGREGRGGRVADQARLSMVFHGCVGRAGDVGMMSRRAEVAIRHGTESACDVASAVVARARSDAARVAAARVRLNAITASTSQAALAVNTPDGRSARAKFLQIGVDLLDDRVPTMDLIRG